MLTVLHKKISFLRKVLKIPKHIHGIYNITYNITYLGYVIYQENAMSGKNLPNTMDFIAQPSESANLEQKAAAGPNPIS